MKKAFSARKVRRQAFLLLIGFAILIVVLALQVVAPVGAVMPRAEADLVSDGLVEVSRGQWLVFEPKAQSASSGFIFYPGGRILAEAYAPLARAVAEAGYLAVIAPMPLNLAILNWAAADAIIEAYPRIETWTIGGHSLGGAMAARYAHANADKVDGLILLAAYPEAELAFQSLNMPIVSVYGERDGLATVEEVEASFAQLPPDTRKVLIEGGNHAQFGWYGEQPGDLPARISREQQHEQVANAALELMSEAGKSI